MISEFNRILNSFEELVSGPIENFWFFFSKPLLFRLLQLLLKTAYYCFLIYILSILEFTLALLFYNDYRLPFLNSFFNICTSSINCVIGLDPTIVNEAHETMNSFLNDVKFMLDTTRQCYITRFWYFLINNSIKRHDTNIKIITTGNVDYNVLISDSYSYSITQNAMVVSNHRSIFDYIVLQSIFFDLNKREDSTNKQTPLRLLSWGTFLDIPNLRLLKQIFSSNENFEVNINTTSSQKYFNKPILFFPEVNVMTKEVKIVQDKLNLQNGNKIFQESLYPRYNTFLGLCHYYQSNTKALRVIKGSNAETPCSQMYFFNITLSYYKPELVSQANHMHSYLSNQNTESHDKWSLLQSYKSRTTFKPVDSNTTSTQDEQYSDCKYQVIQLAPCLLECFLPIQSNDKQPLIIRVHLEKLPLHILLEKNDKQLERFLEHKFGEKDYIINNFENNLKIKEYKETFKK